MDAAAAKRAAEGETSVDPAENVGGIRKRAPVEGATDSRIPAQSSGKRRRMRAPYVVFMKEKKVAKGHAQWWRSDLKRKIDTESRDCPALPCALDAGDCRFLHGSWGKN